MSMGDVYDGPILSKVSISDEYWRDEIKTSNLTVTFSDPEVAELTKKGNILAKKQGLQPLHTLLKVQLILILPIRLC